MFEDPWRWSPRVLEQSQLAVQRAFEIVPKAARSLGELVMLAGLPEVGLAAAGGKGRVLVSCSVRAVWLALAKQEDRKGKREFKGKWQTGKGKKGKREIAKAEEIGERIAKIDSVLLQQIPPRCLKRFLGDGNCQFHTWEDGLAKLGLNISHSDLRTVAASELANNRALYQDFVVGDYDTFVQTLATPGEYAGHLAMQALMNVNKVAVNVFRFDSNGDFMNQARSVPHGMPDAAMLPVVEFVQVGMRARFICRTACLSTMFQFIFLSSRVRVPTFCSFAKRKTRTNISWGPSFTTRLADWDDILAQTPTYFVRVHGNKEPKANFSQHVFNEFSGHAPTKQSGGKQFLFLIRNISVCGPKKLLG